MNDIRLLLRSDPLDKPIQFLLLVAPSSFQHGQEHGSQARGFGRAFPGGGLPEHPGRIEHFVHPTRRFAEQAELLLQEHIDTAEEDGNVSRDAVRIDEDGKIHGDHEDVVALPAEFPDQGAIAHTVRTVERPAGARYNMDDFHRFPPAMRWGRDGRSE